MKIDIKTINTPSGVRVAGWDIIPENQADEDKLCVMRDTIFFGVGSDHVEYAGREGNSSNEDWPIDKLKYRRKIYHDSKDLETWEPDSTNISVQ